MASAITGLSIKVVAGASTTGIAGGPGEAVRIRVVAPAEPGKANAAVENYLAKPLGLPRAAVRIVTGMTSAHKQLEIDGLSKSEIQRRLETELTRRSKPA